MRKSNPAQKMIYKPALMMMQVLHVLCPQLADAWMTTKMIKRDALVMIKEV